MELDGPALAWAEAELGPVTYVRRRAGGVASSIHEVAAGERRYIVRLVPPRPEVPGHDPAAEVRNEALALDALRHLALAPDLIATDPAGERAGVAASIVTCLPGGIVVAPLDVEPLAEAVLAVHGVGIDPSAFAPFETWADVEVPPGGPDALVHRDLHPGNVLVDGGRLGGIVDWVHACRGPIEVDVSRCRVEIAFLAGIEAADAFLERCRLVVPDYDRRWDALVVAELRPWVHDLLAFNAVGASLTVEGILGTFDALTR